MELKLAQTYNHKNIKGQEVEIIDIENHYNYALRIRCLTKFEGIKEPIWVTINWFIER